MANALGSVRKQQRPLRFGHASSGPDQSNGKCLHDWAGQPHVKRNTSTSSSFAVAQVPIWPGPTSAPGRCGSAAAWAQRSLAGLDPGCDPSHDDRTQGSQPHPLLVETVVLDGMWRVADDRAEDGRRYRIAWFDPPFRPPLHETTQALGVCFTGDHRIVLVTWNGAEWSLPGGRPEAGETLEQALAREVREEACARVTSSRYIGCQRVEELDGDLLTYYQARFWARVELDEFRPEHEMTARRLVEPEQFRATLFWGAETAAGLLLERGLAIERRDAAAGGPSG
jgi:ADP-ribose pyrophosphatase YjhB (NUDIX family)